MALDSNSVTFDLPVLNLTFAGPPVKSAQARTLGTGLVLFILMGMSQGNVFEMTRTEFDRDGPRPRRPGLSGPFFEGSPQVDKSSCFLCDQNNDSSLYRRRS